jgi:hypothetical protein
MLVVEFATSKPLLDGAGWRGAAKEIGCAINPRIVMCETVRCENTQANVKRSGANSIN